jgi:hypothetical protein
MRTDDPLLEHFVVTFQSLNDQVLKQVLRLLAGSKRNAQQNIGQGLPNLLGSWLQRLMRRQ